MLRVLRQIRTYVSLLLINKLALTFTIIAGVSRWARAGDSHGHCTDADPLHTWSVSTLVMY